MAKMAPEQWRQIFELLDTALDLPSEQREAWVDALDESRSALQPALRDLLARRANLETLDFLSALPQFTRLKIGALAAALYGLSLVLLSRVRDAGGDQAE